MALRPSRAKCRRSSKPSDNFVDFLVVVVGIEVNGLGVLIDDAKEASVVSSSPNLRFLLETTKAREAFAVETEESSSSAILLPDDEVEDDDEVEHEDAKTGLGTAVASKVPDSSSWCLRVMVENAGCGILK